MTRTAVCAPFEDEPPSCDTYILGHGFQFNPAVWRRRLPDSVGLPALLANLPSSGRWPRVTRGDLLRAGADARTGRAVTDVLIEAYVWGHGLPSKRGPARLRMVFDLNDGHIERRLGETAGILRRNGPPAAYEALSRGGCCRLKRLGPSFFTKLLYFLGWDSSPGGSRPLILDRYVVIGMNRYRGTRWPEGGPWTTDQYAEYIAWAQETATRWSAGTESDVVERVIWEYGKCLADRGDD